MTQGDLGEAAEIKYPIVYGVLHRDTTGKASESCPWPERLEFWYRSCRAAGRQRGWTSETMRERRLGSFIACPQVGSRVHDAHARGSLVDVSSEVTDRVGDLFRC